MKRLFPLALLLSTACSPGLEQACKQACDTAQECNGDFGSQDLEECKNECEAQAVYAEAEISPNCLDATATWVSCAAGLECSELEDTGAAENSECASEFATAGVECRFEGGVNSDVNLLPDFGFGSPCDRAVDLVNSCPGSQYSGEGEGEGEVPPGYCEPGTDEACYSDCILTNPDGICALFDDDYGSQATQNYIDCASSCDGTNTNDEGNDGCCTSANNCDYANDGICDCNGEQSWDAADCWE